MGVLRFLLAISVVLDHSSSIFGIDLVGGRIAVQSFYIISGFYMTLVLNEKYINKNKSYKLFITNRLLRLFPIYWLVLILTVTYALTVVIYTNGSSLSKFDIYVNNMDNMGVGSFIFLIFTNIFLFFQDFIMFLGLDPSTGDLFFTSDYQNTTPHLHRFLMLPQAWTIGVELMFYLIAPFILRRNIKIILILLFSSIFLRYLLYSNGFDFDPWTYRFFPTELAFFLLGNLSYQIYKKIKTTDYGPYSLKIILGFILTFIIFYNSISIPLKIYIYYGCFFTLLPFIFHETKKWKKDIYIGELSYPIYISHLFVLLILEALNIKIISSLGLTLVVFTVLFSIILNEFVAKKIEIYRQKRITLNFKSND